MNGFQETRNKNVNRNLTSDTKSSVRLERDKSTVGKLLNFFGLTQQPFGVTPDPSFLYLSRTHREALASLIYGIENGLGFLALIARPGMGKTTLLFHLLDKFRNSARSVFLFQTQCTSREFLQFLLSDLGLETNGSQDLVRMHEQLNEHLLREARAGKRFIVLVDEAQNLEASVLETIRLLSNFETPWAKLLQIVLSGQPELGNKLARHDMVQLQQRVSSLNRLEPFSGVETQQYIDHRLRLSGYKGGPLLTPDAMAVVTEFSKGIPRNINNLCFNALSLAFALQQKSINATMVREVISDLDISFSQSNEVAREEVGSTFDVSSQSTESDHDKQAQQSSGSDLSLHRSQPDHDSEKEVSPHLHASLELSECSHSAKEEPVEVSQSLSQPSHNAESEVTGDLDISPPSSETNYAAKESTVVHTSSPPHSDHSGSDDVLTPLSPRTVNGSISLSEAKAYMNSFIRSLKSARS